MPFTLLYQFAVIFHFQLRKLFADPRIAFCRIALGSGINAKILAASIRVSLCTELQNHASFSSHPQMLRVATSIWKDVYKRQLYNCKEALHFQKLADLFADP